LQEEQLAIHQQAAAQAAANAQVTIEGPILSVVTFLPIVGVIFIAILNDDESGARNARWIALWTTLITFIISLILVWRFDPASAK
jgi:NADH:ubiquinone oxidoreductase subunit 4 (subunit M)